jgi:hypothetical protein
MAVDQLQSRIPSKAADAAASTGIGEIRAVRGQKSSAAAIFFVTLRKIFGRNR